MSVEIWDYLKPRQAVFEESLRATLRMLTVGSPPALAEAMRYSLLAPGKRLRPMLVILGCEATGGTIPQALPSACALEMIHTYSLIHDDLPAMDDDDLRRGLPTCHVKYGEALGILAGDGLLTLAFETVARGYPPRTAAVSIVELSNGAGAAGMVGGQVLDLSAEGRIASGNQYESGSPTPTVTDLEAIHRRKTGALFRSSLRLGLMAAQGERDGGIDYNAIMSLDIYANAFGLLFQITDDLLDVGSSTEQTGKRVGKDAARGKLTYPGLLGFEASQRRAGELADKAIWAANTFGERGKPLADLARFVVNRDR